MARDLDPHGQAFCVAQRLLKTYAIHYFFCLNTTKPDFTKKKKNRQFMVQTKCIYKKKKKNGHKTENSSYLQYFRGEKVESGCVWGG
jgi:hypothetical protein